MQLLIPFAAALSDAGAHTARDLALPQLSRLLAMTSANTRLGVDEYTLSPPHEQALAAAWGWQGGDGALPFAARAAQSDGLDTGDLAWGLLTPAHWHVGRDHITLADPADLHLGDAESREFLEAIRPLFESEGFVLAHGAPTRWYAAHGSLAELPCASIDRVIGRNVDLWLPNHPTARLVRRLQNEVQMLLYTHALNDARESRGELPVNSFWLSGCGPAQPTADAAGLVVDESLRGPALEQDWAAWADAWRVLDAGPVRQLAERIGDGLPATLWLCGERHAQRFEPAPRGLWQRLASSWRRVEPHTVLESL